MKNLQNQKQFKYIFPFIVLFFIFFNLKLSFIPFVTSNLMFFTIGFLLFITYETKNFFILFHKRNINFLIYYFFILFEILLTPIVHGTTDVALFKNFGYRYFITFFNFYFFACVCRWQGITRKEALKLYVFIYFVQILIIIMAFTNREFQRILINIQDMGGGINKLKDDLIGYRVLGLGFGFDYGTAEMTCALLSGVYLYYTEKVNNIRWLVISIFCAVFGILVARTMFIGIGACGLYFVFFPTEKWNRNRKIDGIIFFFSFIAVLTLIFFTFVDLKKYQRTISWAFDIFIQLHAKKGLKSGSLHTLTHEMLYWPGDKTFFLGDGLYDNQYGNTDIGYMRYILFFGVFGLLSILVGLKLCVNSFFSRKEKQFFSLANAIFFFQLLFLYKLNHLFSGAYCFFMLLDMFDKTEMSDDEATYIIKFRRQKRYFKLKKIFLLPELNK